ncbi:hypothetical protein HN018_06675 [Lichenicola cladoniae]|uniref:Uncharacterized protein n=1 Tax=Lichenicola cladoniae TaxID=1484109 RepID=A0A6M8HN39_9PROT|nr:hypothetical protein [Lichenicola cladoniae]NPD67256.1 hypothetical protein [Acetobacteraceae bacterium]QKE89762.1 hypothetical protein HN018_06675 [Lichenicola cladoniae]
MTTPDPRVAALIQASGHTAHDASLILNELHQAGFDITSRTQADRFAAIDHYSCECEEDRCDG